MQKITEIFSNYPRTPKSSSAKIIEKFVEKPDESESVKNSEDFKFKFLSAKKIPKQELVGFT